MNVQPAVRGVVGIRRCLLAWLAAGGGGRDGQGAAAQLQLATHALQHFFHDGQAQARAAGLAAGQVAPEKRLGHAGQGGGIHARPPVAHVNAHPFALQAGRHQHVGLAGRLGVGKVGGCSGEWGAGLAVAAGVFQQVVDHALQVNRVGPGRQAGRQAGVDLQAGAGLVALAVDGGLHAVGHVHHLQRCGAGAGVFQKLVDDAVDLGHVGHHVVAGLGVGHAHFGLQAQPGQGGAQVVRDAGQHQLAVGLHAGELARHAVEALVDGADFGGGGVFVQRAGGPFARAHLGRGPRQGLQRLVDQPCQHRRAAERQQRGDHQPDQPGAALDAGHAVRVEQQPVAVRPHAEGHPQAAVTVDFTRHDGVGPQLFHQLFGHAAAEGVGAVAAVAVVRLARGNAQALFVGQCLDERDAGYRIGVLQGGTGEVDQRGHLAGALQGLGLEFERTECLHPGQDAACQQQHQVQKGAPEQADAPWPAPQPEAGEGGCVAQPGGFQARSSGTNT